MADKRRKAKGRATSGGFLALPHRLLEHPNWAKLSPRAAKLLIDIAAQYKGKNNGDLVAAFSVMKRRGWTSKDQVYKGLAELEAGGWIIRTRQGRRPSVPTLYAITWKPIDDCGGKLEVKPTRVATNEWKIDHKKFDSLVRPTDQCGPPHGPLKGNKVVPLVRHTDHYR